MASSAVSRCPSSAYWQRWVVTGTGQMGRPSAGKWPLSFLSLSFVILIVFLIFCNCLALLKIARNFQKSWK